MTAAQLRLLADVDAGRVSRHAGHDWCQGRKVTVRLAKLYDAGLIRLVRQHDFHVVWVLTDTGREAVNRPST